MVSVQIYLDNQETSTGSSSVALWINSLKENNGAFEETNHDYLGYSGKAFFCIHMIKLSGIRGKKLTKWVRIFFKGSSSDQDDVQLGEEAYDLRRRYKSPSLGFVYFFLRNTPSNRYWRSSDWTAATIGEI